MGISGLLPVLKSITETKTLDQYRGQTLAIDGYCWLHRAIYSCSQEICLGEDTDKYIVYFIDRVVALQQHGVTPFVVFDGGPLPMKKGTEDERRKNRDKHRALGLQCLRQQQFADARKHFVRGADVSPLMAHRVIRRLRQLDVAYVVAPYEADAQLAFLVKRGIVHGVITEDSDCLPFGCSTVLFKMDRDGVAQEVRTANLKRNDGLSFHMFTDDMFLEMCIFSGCDYLPSLPGVGLKKAYALMKQHGSFTKILRALRMEGKVRVPPTYEAEFERALLTFRHQRVFDPRSKQLVPLTPIPQELLDKDRAMAFLGPILPQETAQAIAEGDVDPITLMPFSDPPPSRAQSAASSHAPPTMPTRPPPSGFIQRKTKSPFKASPLRPLPPPAPAPAIPPKTTSRTLPAWMSRKASQLNAQAPSPPPPPVAKASTPKTISHFFAARQPMLSPSDDTAKAAAGQPTSTAAALSRQQSTDSTTYESQDPSEMDIARSISFSPMDDDVKLMRRDGAVHSDKENTAPNGATTLPATTTTTPATLVSSDNAFARMMRAGSTLHKHTLKRKAPPSGFSHAPPPPGRFAAGGGGGVSGRLKETPMERIKRLAFTSHAAPERRPHQAVIPPTPSAEPESEPLANDDEEADPDSDCLQAVVVRSSVLTVAKAAVADDKATTRHDDDAATTSACERGAMPRRATPAVDAFARFRFGAK